MSTNKAPSAGTKVNLGAKAPVIHESTGPVEPSSLAAESIKQGGAFAENLTSSGVSPGQPASSGEYHSSLSSATGPSSNSASLESAQMSQSSQSERGQRGIQAKSTKTEGSKSARGEKQGQKAPTYVEHLIHAAEETGGKPHGKNLTEGGFEGSGTAEGALPEPGSEDDPGRAAFKKLVATTGPREGFTKGVKSASERKGYAELRNEESA
ncbi:hypothetical protein B0T21DRAFT_388027 [Apiosordaria backusii]|uniref:Uncharacterized protein n=1 Tax=Apiosordaria backusii TaxID=314023 RepID=A0AA39ZS54_9PEZI|nr:hypothetical protein B0T21DRAFT_388027 [Apiosordaria backusii]